MDKIRNILINTFKESNVLAFLGLPMVGKTRYIKQLVESTEYKENICIISLEVLTISTDQEMMLDKIVLELNNNYDKGKRIFVISYIPLDIDQKYLHDVIRRITIFRQSCLSTPSIIFLINSDPKHYPDVFKDIVGINTNIIYLVPSEENFPEVLEYGLKNYTNLSLSGKEKERIYKLTGGIAGLVKPMCYWLNEYKKILNVYDYIELLQNDILKFFADLPDYDLTLIKNYKQGKAISEKDKEYLYRVGIINNQGAICSELISETILEYSRNYDLVINKGRVFVNGKVINDRLTPKEKEVIVTIYKQTYLSREELGKILAGRMYSDYSEESIDQFFSRLRKKLKELGVRENILLTRKRYGYKFN